MGGRKVRAKEISDLLGRFPKTSGFPGTVRKEGRWLSGRRGSLWCEEDGWARHTCFRMQDVPSYLCGLGQGMEPF